jgi:hypothetical protein
MSQEKYIGMDVHQATISVAVMDGDGKLIKWGERDAQSIARCSNAHHRDFLTSLIPEPLGRAAEHRKPD